jgi:hypothetical protein
VQLTRVLAALLLILLELVAFNTAVRMLDSLVSVSSSPAAQVTRNVFFAVASGVVTFACQRRAR